MLASIVGYWASQDQYSMQDLLKFVTEAEHGGFKTCLTSDHFHPWWHDGGGLRGKGFNIR